jgi:hypothetical protein
VKYFFAHSELCVQRDRCIVTVIGLDKNDIDATFAGMGPEVVDQCRGNTAPAVALRDRQVVDIELRSSLLELRQDVPCQSACNLAPDERRDRNKRVILSRRWR